MSEETAPFGNSFFTEAANNKPYFKAAFQGFSGSGKTYTAAKMAIGLHQKIKSNKPIIMFDTEKANKFLIPMFREAGIKLLVKESRSLADLKTTMKMCREGASDVLIIDSISHLWENFLEAYKTKTKKSYLTMLDWGIIKPSWRREFSDVLVNDPYHIIFCGRAGYEYEQQENEDTHKKEIVKSGIKMKVEGETAYEPDFLVLMERFEEVLDKDKKVWREATVIKSRDPQLDGKTFKNPTFTDFEPAIDLILSDPVNDVKVEEESAESLFRTEEDKREYITKKNIVLEKIIGEFTKHYPGQSAEVKQKRVELSEKVFGTTSWTEVEHMSLKVLEAGLVELIKVISDENKKADEVIIGKDKPAKKKAAAKK